MISVWVHGILREMKIMMGISAFFAITALACAQEAGSVGVGHLIYSGTPPLRCSGALVDFGLPDSAKALFLTAGHCARSWRTADHLKPFEIIINEDAATGTVRFRGLGRGGRDFIEAPVRKVVFGSFDFWDAAILEIEATYAQMKDSGVLAWPMSSRLAKEGDPLVFYGYKREGFDLDQSRCPAGPYSSFAFEQDARTYCAINRISHQCGSAPGMSGGPVFNDEGQIVGILTSAGQKINYLSNLFFIRRCLTIENKETLAVDRNCLKEKLRYLPESCAGRTN